MSDLSERQKRILDFIERFIEANPCPPTIREIGKGVGISSTSVVKYNLDALESRGLIARDPDVPRGICLPGRQVRCISNTGNLPERRERILDFIRDFIEENGFAPTIREIGKGVGISSTSVVKYNLEALESKGLILRDRDISRGLRLAEKLAERAANLVRVPLLGCIAAGEPIPVPESELSFDPDNTLELTQDIVKDTRCIYALEVQGDSMIDALIHDGDIILVRNQDRVENGELAAVWLQDKEETTLKRFYLEGRQVRLQPANPTMRAMYYPADRVKIMGTVVGVIRVWV